MIYKYGLKKLNSAMLTFQYGVIIYWKPLLGKRGILGTWKSKEPCWGARWGWEFKVILFYLESQAVWAAVTDLACISFPSLGHSHPNLRVSNFIPQHMVLYCSPLSSLSLNIWRTPFDCEQTLKKKFSFVKIFYQFVDWKLFTSVAKVSGSPCRRRRWWPQGWFHNSFSAASHRSSGSCPPLPPFPAPHPHLSLLPSQAPDGLTSSNSILG